MWKGDTSDEVKLQQDIIKRYLSRPGAWMLRNCYDWDCEETNFWEIICDRFYPIEMLPSKTRNQVRRSLRDCIIKPITAEILINSNGYTVFYEAFERYHDVDTIIPSKESWLSNLKQINNAEFWGVYERESGKLIAYALNTINKKSVNYSTLKAIPSLLNKHYPYYGLLYEMNRHYLNERGFLYVSDGWRSISEHSGIQPFLEKNFLFRKAYCRFNISYVFWVGLIVKLLYPIRNFSHLPLKIKHILKFEEINRQN